MMSVGKVGFLAYEYFELKIRNSFFATSSHRNYFGYRHICDKCYGF